MKILACSILMVALALPVGAQRWKYEAKLGERVDEKSGVAFRRPTLGDLTGTLVTCTLSIQPATVTNGEMLTFIVSYNPCINVPETETFTFNWKSTVSGFTETTTRQKIFRQSSGCVSASYESTIAPTALGIKGELRPSVKVTNSLNGNLICMAWTTLTVN
jgi:hypothetical protein